MNREKILINGYRKEIDMTTQAVRAQEKGQVTIPLEICKKLGLKKGDIVAFVETESGVMIKPAEIIVFEALNEIGEALKDKGMRKPGVISPNMLPTIFCYWNMLFKKTPFEYVEPTKREILSAAKHIVMKDAPIAAAAKKANVDILVILDKKHLLGKPGIDEYVGADIVQPSEAIAPHILSAK